MITIQRGNSQLRISCSEEILKKLQKVLSFTDESVKFDMQKMIFGMNKAKAAGNEKMVGYCKMQYAKLKANQLKCYVTDEGVCYAGHLGYIEKALKEEDLSYELIDVRKIPEKSIKCELKGKVTPRWYQTAALKVAETKPTGVVASCVGSGKSYVAAGLIAQKKVKTLVLVPTRDLVTQTSKDLAGFLTCSVGATDDCDVIVTTQAGILSKHKKGELKRWLKTNSIDMIIYDELQHSASDGFVGLLPDLARVYFRYGLTGTFHRPDGKTLALHAFLSEVLFTYTAKQATEEGFLTPLQHVIHELPGKSSPDYQREYKANYCNPKMPLLAVISKIVWQCPEEAQILIMVNQKDAGGAEIQKYLNASGVASVYISGDDKRQTVNDAIARFNSKQIAVLIGSKIIGEGIDIRSTDHLIMAQGGKSSVAITQALGRAVRLNPGKTVATVHDFEFVNTKFMVKHLDSRVKLYHNVFASKEILFGEITECKTKKSS